VLDDAFGIKRGFASTVHSYTTTEDPRLPAQGPAARAGGGVSMIPDHHRRGDGRRARAAAAEGQARRHRDPGAHDQRSVVDLTSSWTKPVTVEAVNDAFREAAAGSLRGILDATDEELVSATSTATALARSSTCRRRRWSTATW
jgi:glyceraldehyde 3-phosphate dehydrogenase